MQKISLCLIILLLSTVFISAQDDEITPYQIALWRIEDAQETNALRLDLGGLELRELPPEIGNLTNLRWLSLSDNPLTSLPPEIGNLMLLNTLYITNTSLNALPPEIGNLESLQWLAL